MFGAVFNVAAGLCLAFRSCILLRGEGVNIIIGVQLKHFNDKNRVQN